MEQERRFSIENDYESVFRRLCDILDNNEMEIRIKDIDKKTIEAITKRSWKSFGERIVFKLFNISKSKVVISLSSKPIIPLMVIDYCKNFENIEIITNEIKKIFPCRDLNT